MHRANSTRVLGNFIVVTCLAALLMINTGSSETAIRGNDGTANTKTLAANSSPTTVTVQVDRGLQVGVSKLSLGVTHTQYSVDRWNDPQAVESARELLSTSTRFQNQHIMGWGANNPEPSPGVFNWNSLDSRINIMRQTGGTPVITLCCAPDWMKGGQPGETDWSRLEVAPDPEHYEDFAALAREVAKRYPDVLYYQVWNELKGFFDHSRDRWNYEGYTTLYNMVYDELKSVNPAIQVGGPYVVMQTWGCRSCMRYPSDLAGPYGTFDQRPLDVIEYWLANKRGADFISVDAGIRNWDGVEISSEFQAAQKFTDAARWVATRTSLPLWWAEWYATRWGDPNQWDHAHQNAAMAASLIQMIETGATVSLRWQPQGVSTAPYQGNAESIWSDTRIQGGGQPFPYYTTAKVINSFFAPGTPLYQVTVSPSEALFALASGQQTMLVNSTASLLAVDLDDTALTLSPYEVRFVDASWPPETRVVITATPTATWTPRATATRTSTRSATRSRTPTRTPKPVITKTATPTGIPGTPAIASPPPIVHRLPTVLIQSPK